MLMRKTVEILQRLRLFGMIKALEEQDHNEVCRELSFEERLGLLVDREANDQDNRRMASRLRHARLRQDAAFEDIDWKAARGLHKATLLELASCQWIRDHRNVIIIGPTGVGKTFLACSLAHKACREGFSSLYQRASRMFQELGVSRGEGRYLRLIKALAKPELLLLDDWGLEPLGKDQRHDLLELFEERLGRKSIIITSQIPVDKWHDLIGEPTLADAILDRVIHNSHVLNLKGESMRKRNSLSSKTKAES